MSIRFKFRSSVSFDTIEIDDGKPYISVGELRSKILLQKKLNGVYHKDFDLVFLDDLTGQEYNDDEFKIPSGSSVIIKRVPAKPVPSPISRHHKLEASELSEDIPKANAGMDYIKPGATDLEKKPAPEDLEHIKLEKVANVNGIDLHKADLPSELRCPVCNTYFKEAVMIPCCQHSFCKKCISEVLSLTARCPRCSSSKYKVEHLLPNLSLRHAIEHFLEAHILATAPETNLQKYVPDGESGIQGKEVSAITKRKLDLLYSTSATEKGSNQNMAESVYESLNKKSTFLDGTRFHTGKSCAIDLLNSNPSPKVTNGDGGKHDDLATSGDSQGENQPVMPRICMPDGGGDRSYAVDNRNRKVGRTCYNCGSPGHFIRHCPIASTEYHHQHNPLFHAGNHMFQGGVSVPGYGMPYWNASAFPPAVNPYMNMYGNPGMVPFSATMVPVTPYGVPSTYGSLPLPSGVTRMGGLAPVGTRVQQPSRHSENLELQNSDNRTKYSHEKRQRSSDYEDERLPEYKSHRDGGKALSNSEESHGRKLQKDYRSDQKMNPDHGRYGKRSHSSNDRRDHGSYHTDISASGVEDVHSGNYRYHDEVRYNNNKKYQETSRRHHSHNYDHNHNSREQSDSDCSCSARHQIKREKDGKRRQMEDGFRETRDRRKMLNDSDEEYHHHHSKRKRLH